MPGSLRISLFFRKPDPLKSKYTHILFAKGKETPMRRPQVDYRKLRLQDLNTPTYRHLHLLWGWAGYFLLYFLTENLIPPEACHVIHTPLDDRIPFQECFVIFYVGWYGLILLSLGYFLLYSVDSFKNLQTYIIITQALAMAVYVLYPSRQDLRPEVFPRENILTSVMAFLYSIDTPTGVCPSLHVAISIGIASAWLREKQAATWLKAGITLFCIGVCCSVSFVKQHSVVDIVAAVPVCLIAEWFVYFRKRSP